MSEPKNGPKLICILEKKLLEIIAILSRYPTRLKPVSETELGWSALFRPLSFYQQCKLSPFSQLWPFSSMKKLFRQSFDIPVTLSTAWGEATWVGFWGFKIENAVFLVIFSQFCCFKNGSWIKMKLSV